MMVIENKYEIEQIVYLKTDSEQNRRIVLSFRVFKGGEIVYQLALGATTSDHYEFEISEEKNLVDAI